MGFGDAAAANEADGGPITFRITRLVVQLRRLHEFGRSYCAQSVIIINGFCHDTFSLRFGVGMVSRRMCAILSVNGATVASAPGYAALRASGQGRMARAPCRSGPAG